MAEGGVASSSDKPGQWQFEVDELKAAVQVANAAGTYVMAHCYTDPSIKNCLKAGVKTIEHGNLMTADTAELMAKKGAYLVPTLTVYQVLTKYGRDEGLSAFVLDKLKSVMEVGLRSLETAYRAGVKIGSGTDIIGPFQYLKTREFSIKAEVMTPMEVIVSATKTNAELFGRDHRFGTVAPGKSADLIVVDGNPLMDISIFESAREKVLMVMKEGKVMKDIR